MCCFATWFFTFKSFFQCSILALDKRGITWDWPFFQSTLTQTKSLGQKRPEFIQCRMVMCPCLAKAGSVSCFSVCTAVSARSCVDGWQGADLMCLTPLCRMNILNLCLVKQVPLFVTTVSGNPWTANDCGSFSTVAVDMQMSIGYTFNHFECASTSTTNIFPVDGPA